VPQNDKCDDYRGRPIQHPGEIATAVAFDAGDSLSSQAPRHVGRCLQYRVTTSRRRTVASATARLSVARWAVLMLLIATGAPAAGWAHASDKGFVLLLPTGYYLAGGTCAVAASFLLVLLVPEAVVRRAAAWRLDLCTLPRITTAWTSAFAFLAL